MKKYELIESNISGLYRIKALYDFSDVKKGDVGGYVSGEHNLSHYGNCWVYDDAKVYHNAEIYGNAKVYDNVELYNSVKIYDSAIIYDNTKIHDNTMVYGNAKINGNARIYGNVKIHGNAKIYGNTKIYNFAEIYGNAVICNKTCIKGSYKTDNGYYCFTNFYKYHAQPIFDGSDTQKIQLGCYERTIDEWRNYFWNNEKEFPKGSEEAEYRLKALNMCLIWLGEEPIKMEDIL